MEATIARINRSPGEIRQEPLAIDDATAEQLGLAGRLLESIDIIFGRKSAPDPPELVDVNCDYLPDIFDVIYLIDYAFSGGAAPCR